MESLARTNIAVELLPLLARLITEMTGEVPEELPVNHKCSYRSLGRWINFCDYAFLMETLRLEDAVFDKVYPNAQFAADSRRELASELEAHCERCDFCRAKRGADLALKAEVDEALVRDRVLLRSVLTSAAGKRSPGTLVTLALPVRPNRSD